MCFFITIATPESHAERVRLVHSGRGLLMDPTANPSAIAAAGDDRVAQLVTGGGCYCAWYRRPPSALAEEKIEHAQTRYRKRGWSDAKIERALASMRRDPEPNDGVHPVIVDLVRAIVDKCGEVAVWIHDFRGKVETESYQIRRRTRCAAAEVEERRRWLDLDVVLEVGEGSVASGR